MVLTWRRKLLQNHLRRLEKSGKLIKVKASYKLGDELKKAPKKAKAVKSKTAAKPKAAAKPAAAKPKASKPKKAAPEKKAAGKQGRSACVMLCLQTPVTHALCTLTSFVAITTSLLSVCESLRVVSSRLRVRSRLTSDWMFQG